MHDIVHAMLYEKEFVSSCLPEINNNNLDIVKSEKDPDESNELVFSVAVNGPPFPFKIAKALDPTIYRNIEYDAWTEVRRGK